MELLISRWRSGLPVLGVGVTVIIALFFLVAVSSSNRIFPNTDEWSYIYAAGSPSSIFSYLFQQHNDHRIPLQKLLHLGILYLGGFDFRNLVVVNMLLAGVTSLALMFAARNYRGGWAIGDLAIPFLCMNFGFGMSLVGFELQFLSSVMFVSLFLLAISLSDGGVNKRQINLAAFWLILLSWTGLNGVVVGACLAFSILTYFFLHRSNRKPDVSNIVTMSIAMVMNIAQFVFWKPSEASQGMAPIRQIVDYFYGLCTSAYPVYSHGHSTYIAVFIALLLLMGGYLGIKQVFKKGDTLATFSLLASTMATFLLLLSVAYGRAQVSAWAPGTDMHYGVLTVIIPAALWMIISKFGGKVTSGVIGGCFVVLSVTAFMFSAEWRLYYVAQSGPLFRSAQMAIASEKDPKEVTDTHMSAFYYSDSPAIRKSVSDGIVTLRQFGGWEYKP